MWKWHEPILSCPLTPALSNNFISPHNRNCSSYATVCMCMVHGLEWSGRLQIFHMQHACPWSTNSCITTILWISLNALLHCTGLFSLLTCDIRKRSLALSYSTWMSEIELKYFICMFHQVVRFNFNCLILFFILWGAITSVDVTRGLRLLLHTTM